MAGGDQAVERRSHLGIPPHRDNLFALGAGRAQLRLGGLELGACAVEGGLAEELALDQAARTRVFRARIRERRLRLGDAGFSRRHRSRRLGGIDADQHLPLADPVARIDSKAQDATRHLRSQRRLADRLDRRLGSDHRHQRPRLDANRGHLGVSGQA